MLNLILLVIAILVVGVMYYFIIKPYLTYRRYIKLLKGLGYKVLVHPYRPFGAYFRQMMRSDRSKYGDVVKSFKDVYPSFDITVGNLYNQPIIQIINPDLLKQFYQNANENYYEKADIAVSAFKMLIKNGLLMKEGQQWKQRRRIISSVFSHTFLINLLPDIDKICLNRLQQWEKKSKIENQGRNYQQVESNGNKKQRYRVNLNLILQQIFSEVMVRLFFGSQPTQTLEGKNICEFINQVLAGVVNEMKSPLFAILGTAVASKKLKHKLNSFKHLARNLINKRLQQIESKQQKSSNPSDIIEALVLSGKFSNQKNSSQQNEGLLTLDDLIGEFCTFFIAGMDTTSNFMTSLVYELSKSKFQQITNKLKQQIKETLGKMKHENLTFEDIKQMNYTERIQKQGLRMFSPVNGIFTRKSLKFHYIKDIPIEKGLILLPRNRPNFFREDTFQDPNRFDPERWRYSNTNIHPYGYIPFSAGARTCVGNHLALMESKIVLCRLFSRYDKIILDKQNYIMTMVLLYAPQKMMVTLQK